MEKYSFRNDYSESAHPRILYNILDTNIIQNTSYGDDDTCKEAISIIKAHIKREDVDIHFMTGGTIVNLTAISSFLRPYEAVISSDIGHIYTHETGAIEFTGHKVIPIKTENGKLNVEQVKKVLDEHTDLHMVKPRMVYISNSTENGLVYLKSELTELSNFCKNNSLLLYMDGARLGSALCSKHNDISMAEIASLVDAFYIGATKNGALFGEALVICNDLLKENFRYCIKQKGALLSKGWLLGIQFYELFRDDLYYELATNANNMAELLAFGLTKLKIDFFVEPQTNQLFPILNNELAKKLEEKYLFYENGRIDENKCVYRFVTSWATEYEQIVKFLKDLESLLN